MKFFSHIPNDGFLYHDTLEDAKKRVNDAFLDEKESSLENGYWDESVDEFCYGVVTARAEIVGEISADDLDDEGCTEDGFSCNLHEEDDSIDDYDLVEQTEEKTENP